MEFTEHSNEHVVNVTLDEYEVSILVRALEQHIALATLDVAYAEKDAKEQDIVNWRNSPDLRHAEEMLDRAIDMLDTADAMMRQLERV